MSEAVERYFLHDGDTGDKKHLEGKVGQAQGISVRATWIFACVLVKKSRSSIGYDVKSQICEGRDYQLQQSTDIDYFLIDISFGKAFGYVFDFKANGYTTFYKVSTRKPTTFRWWDELWLLPPVSIESFLQRFFCSSLILVSYCFWACQETLLFRHVCP